MIGIAHLQQKSDKLTAYNKQTVQINLCMKNPRLTCSCSCWFLLSVCLLPADTQEH